jgi:DNA-binding NarL/FixJ family response regulator
MILPVILVMDTASEYLQKHAKNFFVKDFPCRIISTTDLQMGIDAALENKPDIILLVLSVRLEDGITAIGRIKNEHELKDIPILITLEETPSAKDVEKIFFAGASDIFYSPLDKTEFMARLQSQIRQSKYIQLLKDQALVSSKEEDVVFSSDIIALKELCDQMAEMIRIYMNERKNIIAKIKSMRIEKKDEQMIVDVILNTMIQNNMVLEHYESGCRNFLTEDIFLKKLMKIHPGLHPSDLALCLLLRKNLPSKEIASLTYRSINTVKVARSRLRRRLGLEMKDNLYKYLISV